MDFEDKKIYNFEDLPQIIQAGINKAYEINSKSYSPYFNYNVSCIIVTDSDRLVEGVNCEACNGDCVCAEVNAVNNWILNFRNEPIKYLITYGKPVSKDLNSKNFTTPCGRCRQRIMEVMEKDRPIISVNETREKALVCKLDTLLPFAFSPENL